MPRSHILTQGFLKLIFGSVVFCSDTKGNLCVGMPPKTLVSEPFSWSIPPILVFPHPFAALQEKPQREKCRDRNRQPFLPWCPLHASLSKNAFFEGNPSPIRHRFFIGVRHGFGATAFSWVWVSYGWVSGKTPIFSSALRGFSDGFPTDAEGGFLGEGWGVKISKRFLDGFFSQSVTRFCSAGAHDEEGGPPSHCEVLRPGSSRHDTWLSKWNNEYFFWDPQKLPPSSSWTKSSCGGFGA